MKICHLTSAHPRYDVRIFVKQCVSLAKANYDVSLVVADDLSNESLNGVSIYSVGANRGNRFSRMTRTVWRVYKKALGINADVYHFHDPELVFVGLLLRRKGKKVIYDVHEDLPKQIMAKEWIKLVFRGPISRVMNKIELWAAAKFNAISCATKHIQQRFLFVNRNTYNINNFPITDEFLKTDIKAQEERSNYICYIGGITEIRGINQLIDSLEYIDNIKLIMAGSVSPEYLNFLRSKKGWASVNYLGSVDRTKIKGILAESRLGIVTFLPVPNHIDAQPNKMFEYMSASLPVVASNFPLWRDVIEDGNCGICVNPIDPKAIAQAISHLINNPKKAQVMGKNGQEAVRNKFNWTVESLKLESIYRAL